MNHLVILPLLLPLLTGIVLLLPPSGKNVAVRRVVSVAMALATLIASSLLLFKVEGGAMLYALGNWQAPFGIVLYADGMAALLVVLTSLLALACILYATRGEDNQGSFYHPLMHFLLFGVNGAFFTGDLFNLFVFFEVLLIASYALLMHGGDKHTTRGALHYVILNLVGSAVFLIALGILYGVLGTLNMADMAVKVQVLKGDDAHLARIGGYLLLIVFALKAALLPLHLWLPATYATARPVVAAMFAVMTKVGVYAMLRVYTLIFGAHAGELAGLADELLWWLALATLVVGGVGVLASQDLRRLCANLILISVGTLVAAIALQSVAATAFVLYYLVHSTLASAGLFLLADLIARQRGKVGDRLTAGRGLRQPRLLGSAFILAAVALAGLPPLSGFVAKVWLLRSSLDAGVAQLFWPVYLLVSLAVLVALSKAGTALFWQRDLTRPGVPLHGPRVLRVQLLALVILLGASPVMTLWSGPLGEFSYRAAGQVHHVPAIVEQVLMQKGGQ